MSGDRALVQFRLTPGAPVHLASTDTHDTPIGPQDKDDGKAALAALGDPINELQQALWAQGRGGGERRVLVILQGMDTAGKGGLVRHVGGLLEPQGMRLSTFSAPTSEELAHDFLWRVRNALPEPGVIGFFDRSHYEDVVIARVEGLAKAPELERRIAAINAFERELVADGVSIVKVFLHISPDEQLERLTDRLDREDKQWKYTPADREARRRWGAYQSTYADVLARCASDDAPWHVVPGDRKWYARWVVATMLHETLTALDPQVPGPTYDVAAERELLRESDPLA